MAELLNSRAAAFRQATQAVQSFAQARGISEIPSRGIDSGVIGVQFLFPWGDSLDLVLELVPVFQAEAFADLTVRVYHPDAEDDFSIKEYVEVEEALLALKDHLQSNSNPRPYST